MYGYNRQEHCSKKTTPFSLTLSSHPSGPDTSHIPTTIGNTEDGYGKDVRTTDLSRSLVQVFHAIVLFTYMELAEAQERYKKYFYRSAKPQKPLMAGMEFHLDRAPRSMATEAEKLVQDPRSKHRTNTKGPYKVFNATYHTVTIRSESVEDTVSLDRIIPIPQKSPSEILQVDVQKNVTRTQGNFQTKYQQGETNSQ